MLFHQLTSLLLASILLIMLVPIKQSKGKIFGRELRASIYKQFKIGGNLEPDPDQGKDKVIKKEREISMILDKKDPTSDTICLDDDQCAYRPKGYKCINRENGLPVGSLQKKFEDHGRATLIFKNCNDHGYVKVLLNNKPIRALPRRNKGEKIDYGFYSDYYDDNGMWGSVGKIIMEAEFEVKPGDVLTLEEVGATIKVFSLTIVRDNEYEEEVHFDMKSNERKKLLVGSAVQSPLNVLLGLKSIPKIVNGKVIAGESTSARLTLLKKLPLMDRKPTIN